MSNDTEMTSASKRQWELLVGCMPALHSYVRRAVGSSDAANDVVQEVSVRVLTGEGPAEPGRFLAWSRGIARHVIALDWRMRRRALAETPLEEDHIEMHSYSMWDPEQHIDARSLARAMAGIDSDAIELLVRRYVLEESGKELADQMEQTPAAVRMRLMRLRSTLSARFLPRAERAGKRAAVASPVPALSAISYTPTPAAPRRRRRRTPTANSSLPVFPHQNSRTASTHTG